MSKTQALDESTVKCVMADLLSAESNDHSFDGWTNEDIAGDIIAYDDDFGKGWTPDQLAPYVAEARKRIAAV